MFCRSSCILTRWTLLGLVPCPSSHCCRTRNPEIICFFSLWALSDIFFTDHSFYHPYIYVYTYSFYLHSTCALSSHLSIFPSFTHPAPLCHSSMPLNLPIYSSSYPPHFSISPLVYPSIIPIYPSIPSTHLSTDLCIQSLMHSSLYWSSLLTNLSLCPFIHSSINL